MPKDDALHHIRDPNITPAPYSSMLDKWREVARTCAKAARKANPTGDFFDIAMWLEQTYHVPGASLVPPKKKAVHKEGKRVRMYRNLRRPRLCCRMIRLNTFPQIAPAPNSHMLDELRELARTRAKAARKANPTGDF